MLNCSLCGFVIYIIYVSIVVMIIITTFIIIIFVYTCNGIHTLYIIQ